MTPRIWDERVVPRLVDASLRGREVGELRGRLCADLSGDVVEIGFGSGLNVRWYPAGVASVDAVEPSDVGWELSERRRSRGEVPIRRAGLDGQHLALPDATYDAALITFSLCTIPDPALAIREVRRVVKPGARMYFLEHGLCDDAGVQRWQRRLDPLQRRVAGGCHLSREIPELISANGWQGPTYEELHLPGPGMSRPWTHLYLGSALSG